MKKRILSIILSIVMLVGLLPTTALAEGTEYTVYVAGEAMPASADGSAVSYYVNGENGAAGTVTDTEPQSGWNAKLSYDTAEQTLVLEADGLVAPSVYVDDFSAPNRIAVYAPDAPLRLVLKNNPSKIGSSDTESYNGYGINAKKALTIDINVSGSTITAPGTSTTNRTSTGISTGGNIIINSSDPSNELTVASTKSSGGSTYGILTSYYTLTLNGGVVRANAGGGSSAYDVGISCRNIIVNDGATVYGTGGSNGQSQAHGISVGSSMTINSGAKVYAVGGENTTKSTAGLGIAPDGYMGSLTVNGGILEASGKKRSGSSYGVYCTYGSTVAIHNGQVKMQGGKGTSGSYGFYAAAGEVSFTMTGGTLELSCDTGAQKKMSSNVAPTLPTAAYGWKTSAGDDLTLSTTTGYTYDAAHTYLYVETLHAHPVCGAACTHDAEHENITWTAWDGTDKDGATNGFQLTEGNWYLTDDVKVTSEVNIVGTVNLCLNGYSITRRGNRTITVSKDATLNLCDCNGSGQDNGSVTNNADAGIRNEGALTVYGGTVECPSWGIINTGTLTVYGGSVASTSIYTGDNSARGIYNTEGTVYVYGGTVSSNSYGIWNEGGTANVTGGTVTATGSNGYGIYNRSNGTVTVSGGTVTATGSNGFGIYNHSDGASDVGTTTNVSGTANVSGSFLGIYNSGTLTVSGGTVKSTGTDGNNYGIYNYYHGAGSLELSGAPTITGATAGVYLDDGSITLGGALTYTEENAISVGMETPGTFTTGWTAKMVGNAENYGSYFTSAMDGYTVQPDGSELKLAVPPVDIYLNDDPVTSEQSLTLPGKGQANNHRQYTVKVLDQYGQEMTNPTVEWSITGTDTTGISVNNGLVAVTEYAAVGDYTLTATCDGKSDSITIKVEKAESVATSIKIFKGENEVTADTIYIPEQYRNTVNYTAVVYDQYDEVMSVDDAQITRTHTNKTIDNLTIASTEVESNRSWDYYVDASTGKAGSFDLVLTSGNASASVRITFAVLNPQTITCANVTGTYGQTEELKLNPSGKQTTGAYGFAIKSGASTDVVDVAADGKLTIKNAGETTIVVTAPGDATHASASVEVKVTIAPMEVDEPTVVGTYFYTGSEQTVTLDGFNDSYMTIAGNKGTNAGGYEVVITLDTNHTWKSGSDGKVQWSIEPATPNVTWPVGTAYVKDTSVTLTGGSATGVGGENVVGSFTLDTINLTSVGEKTVAITFTPTGTNYGGVVKVDYIVSVSKRVVESAAEQTPITNAVYGTEQNALGLPATVEITVSGNKKFTVPVDWSGYYATNLNAQTLTGTLNLSKIADEVVNPNNVTASIVVDLQKKNAAVFNYENKTATYTGSPISHEISGEPEGVASISYSYVGTGETEYAASSTAPVNAGTYKVTATFTMQTGYAFVAPKTATLTINPREVGLDWSAPTGEELVYSGTAKTLTAVATGLVDGDSCTVTVELVDDNINVGTFSYEATALSNQNYKLPVDVSSPEYTITPKTLTITADSHEVYVGNRQPELTYTVDGLVGSDMLTTAPALTTDANMNRVGAYDIIPSGAEAGENYSITYVNGTLTVKNYPYIPSNPTYPPIVDDSENGDVAVTPKNPEQGDTVVIIPDPDPGYEVDDVIVTDENGRPIRVTDNGDGSYSFRQPDGKVKITVTFREIGACPRDYTCPMYGYTDLDRYAWYHDGVHFCLENDLMNGVSSNRFDPNGTTTRAMIVTILWRLEGDPVVNYAMDFSDVAANMWYTEAIRWAASEGIVEGYDGKFDPTGEITREQFATILWRYAKYKGYDVSVGENTNILSYDDAFDVAEWAIPAMQWACGAGLMQGDGVSLTPKADATRAQAAALFQRFCENVAEK